jgi:hypothetical protein
MLSVDKDAFSDLSQIRSSINDALIGYKRVTRLKASITQPDSILSKQLISVELWHFMYKNILSSQVCCSSPQKPYITLDEQKTLYKGYFQLTHLIRKAKNVQFFFLSQDSYSLFAWVSLDL